MMEQHCPVGYGTGTPDLDRTKQGFQGGLISTVIFLIDFLALKKLTRLEHEKIKSQKCCHMFSRT